MQDEHGEEDNAVGRKGQALRCGSFGRFNDGSEVGVGTTSLLWVLALAGADRLGLSLHVTAKLTGLATLLALGATASGCCGPPCPGAGRTGRGPVGRDLATVGVYWIERQP
jgi:hypothetical protein